MLGRRVPVPGWLRSLYRSSLVIGAIGIGGTLALEAWGRNLWSLPTWENGAPFVLAMLYLFGSIFIGAGYILVAAIRARPRRPEKGVPSEDLPSRFRRGP